LFPSFFAIRLPAIISLNCRLAICHHGAHRKGYVANCHKMLNGKPEEGKSLEKLIMNGECGVFNNADQPMKHGQATLLTIDFGNTRTIRRSAICGQSM
jgi:hypothetical protein